MKITIFDFCKGISNIPEDVTRYIFCTGILKKRHYIQMIF